MWCPTSSHFGSHTVCVSACVSACVSVYSQLSVRVLLSGLGFDSLSLSISLSLSPSLLSLYLLPLPLSTTYIRRRSKLQVAANVGGRTEPHYLISYGSGTPEANGIYVRMPGTSDVERPNGAAMYYCSAGYTISLELVGGTSGYILGKVRARVCVCVVVSYAVHSV